MPLDLTPSKILHDALTQGLKEVPEGLITLIVIPFTQFVWHQWQEKRPEQRRNALRRKIRELDEYLNIAPAGSVEHEDAAQELESARKELLALVIRSADKPVQKRQEIRDSVTAVTEFLRQPEESMAPKVRDDAENALARLRARLVQPGDRRESPLGAAGQIAVPAAAAAPVISRRSWWRSLLLLYYPSGVWGWIIHSLFFMAVVITAGLTIDVSFGDDDAGDGLIGWIILTLLFRGLAFLPIRGGAPVAIPRRGWRSWLLLYAPKGIGAWIFHVLFYAAAVITLIASPIAATDDLDNLYGLPVFIGALAILRLAAVRLDASATKKALGAAAAGGKS